MVGSTHGKKTNFLWGPFVQPSHVTGLITLIRDKVQSSKDTGAVAYFANTLEFLRGLQQSGGVTEGLSEIVVGGPV